MDNQETKIRKGQAFNLAVADAIAAQQAQNPKYIYQQFLYYMHLANIVQTSDIDEIQEVLNNPKFDEAVKNLMEAASCKVEK